MKLQCRQLPGLGDKSIRPYTKCRKWAHDMRISVGLHKESGNNGSIFHSTERRRTACGIHQRQ